MKNIEQDANTLNKKLYQELLYIIGIEESKQHRKYTITSRKKPQQASLLIMTLAKVKEKTKNKYINTQLFDFALALCLTWINRILFLKILENQLVSVHQSKSNYAFLNGQMIDSFKELNDLFFEVLPKAIKDRPLHLQQQFAFIPTLNLPLFQQTTLEKQMLTISALPSQHNLPVFKKPTIPALPTLRYLFQFLEERKNQLSPAIIGLLFEKINGYKNGAVFTPSFITMYMCKISLEKAIIQKFNDAYKWKVKTLEQLSHKIYKEDLDLSEANKVFNEIKICDPAIGSGHFLVSALNELLRIKSTLKILCDKTGRKIQDWTIDIINDALHIKSTTGKTFEYIVKRKKDGQPYIDKEIQRVQETLFQEKRYLLKHCLFGIDINAQVVEICRLRLWMELWKNSYYTSESGFKNWQILTEENHNIIAGNSFQVFDKQVIPFKGKYFDVILGNPPYVEYRQIDKPTLQLTKSYQTNYQSTRPNLYQYFIELGYYLLKPNGLLCFINPNQFLTVDVGFGLRKFLLEHTVFQYIIDLSYLKIFASAATYTAIWSFQKTTKENYAFPIYKYKTLSDLEKPIFLHNKKDIIDKEKLKVLTTPHQQLLTKIEKGKTKLSDLCTLRWGTSKSGYGKLKIKQEAYQKLARKEQEKYRPLLQTRDIKRYIIDWKKEYLPTSVYSNKMITIFQIPKKIVIARMTLQLQAAIDTEQRFVGKSTVLFRLAKSVTFEYLLALLNSTILNFYYHTYFENTHMSGGYLRFDIPYLSQLPIPIISLAEQAIFIQKTQLLLANQNNEKAREKLGLEIDELVYELYELTAEEKAAIIKAKKFA